MIDTSKPPAWLPVEPDWLSLPDGLIDPEAVTLWSCRGTDITPRRKWWQRRLKDQPRWRVLTYSKELSEAYDAHPRSCWKWDGKPAQPITLASAMVEARVGGDTGVRIRGFRDGKWIVIREFPAGVPLGCDR